MPSKPPPQTHSGPSRGGNRLLLIRKRIERQKREKEERRLANLKKKKNAEAKKLALSSKRITRSITTTTTTNNNNTNPNSTTNTITYGPEIDTSIKIDKKVQETKQVKIEQIPILDISFDPVSGFLTARIPPWLLKSRAHLNQKARVSNGTIMSVENKRLEDLMARLGDGYEDDDWNNKKGSFRETVCGLIDDLLGPKNDSFSSIRNHSNERDVWGLIPPMLPDTMDAVPSLLLRDVKSIIPSELYTHPVIHSILYCMECRARARSSGPVAFISGQLLSNASKAIKDEGIDNVANQVTLANFISHIKADHRVACNLVVSHVTLEDGLHHVLLLGNKKTREITVYDPRREGGHGDFFPNKKILSCWIMAFLNVLEHALEEDGLWMRKKDGSKDFVETFEFENATCLIQLQQNGLTCGPLICEYFAIISGLKPPTITVSLDLDLARESHFILLQEFRIDAPSPPTTPQTLSPRPISPSSDEFDEGLTIAQYHARRMRNEKLAQIALAQKIANQNQVDPLTKDHLAVDFPIAKDSDEIYLMMTTESGPFPLDNIDLSTILIANYNKEHCKFTIGHVKSEGMRKSELNIADLATCYYRKWFNGDFLDAKIISDQVLGRNQSGRKNFIYFTTPTCLQIYSHKGNLPKRFKSIPQHLLKLRSGRPAVFINNVANYHWTVFFVDIQNETFDLYDPQKTNQDKIMSPVSASRMRILRDLLFKITQIEVPKWNTKYWPFEEKYYVPDSRFGIQRDKFNCGLLVGLAIEVWAGKDSIEWEQIEKLTRPEDYDDIATAGHIIRDRFFNDVMIALRLGRSTL